MRDTERERETDTEREEYESLLVFDMRAWEMLGWSQLYRQCGGNNRTTIYEKVKEKRLASLSCAFRLRQIFTCLEKAVFLKFIYFLKCKLQKKKKKILETDFVVFPKIEGRKNYTINLEKRKWFF